MIIRRLIVPLTVAVVTCHAGQGFAQGAFPAPLPGPGRAEQRFAVSAGQRRGSRRCRRALPVRFRPTGAAPLTGAAFERAPAPPSQAGGPPDDCMKKFMPLREEAEKRGKLIKAASERQATPDEACKLIGNFGQAEIKMIKYRRNQFRQMRDSAADRRPDEERPQEHRGHAEESLRAWRSRRSKEVRPARA